MTHKELYLAFCEQESQLPLFFQPWWLDAVCAGRQWEVLLSFDKEGRVQAVMPYMLCSTLRLKYIQMPPQTPVQGIWIRQDKQVSLDAWREVCNDFSAQLAQLGLAYFSQQFPTGSACAIPLRDNGFKVKEQFTYLLDDNADLDKTLDSFSKNIKRQLQKSLTLHIDNTMQPEDFFRFCQDCFSQKNKTIPYTREFFLVLQKKAERTDQCAILRVQNMDNETLAAVFLVWDKQTMYFLLPCISPVHTDTGAGALLVWETIKFAHQKKLQLDFVESSKKPIVSYKQFGAQPHARYLVSKYYKGVFRLINFFRWFRDIGR